jgi:hypothetical protein
MKSFRFWSVWLLAIMLAGNVAAQDLNAFSLLISPRDVSLNHGEGVKFEAQVFGLNGIIPSLANYTWRVEPDSFGTISEDGFFIAGRYEGEAKVICEARFGIVPLRLLGRVNVIIGRPHDPAVKVIVAPRNAVVPPGTSQKYTFTFVTANNIPVTDFHVKWAVEPHSLGEINQDGVFTAGSQLGQGLIIAFVEIRGALYRGFAQVTVAKEPTGIISGQVTDQQTNLPVAAAHVWAELIGRIKWRVEAEVDDEGNYVLRHLIPGLYVVKADARKYLPEFWEEKSHFDEATPVSVAEDDSVSGIDFTLSKGGTIAGFVGMDGDSSEIAGAHVLSVSAVEPRNQRKWRHAVTDENGNYEITTLPTGSYVLSADAAGYKFEYYDNAASFGEADPVSLTDPETVSGIDFYLAGGTAIAGNVKNSNGDPLNRAVVRIMRLENLSPRPIYFREVRTDENGDYIAEVRPGKYFVRAEARGYLGEFYDDAPEFSDADTVTVRENQHVKGIDFVLNPLASISGNVSDAQTGEPLEAVVYAFPELSRIVDPTRPAIEARHPYAAKTDSLGNYVIENVRPGKYYVRAEAHGYLPEFWKEAEELSEADVVVITESTGAEGINFTLSRGGAISGTVYSEEDSTELQGAVVRVFSATGNVFHRAVTDENGDYRVTGLRTGDYYVHARAEGFEGEFYDDADDRGDATLVRVEAGKETGGIDFYLEQINNDLASISGVISSDSTGNPIPHAFVLAVPVVPPGQAFFDLTDQFGFYRLTRLPAASYIVLAWAPGYVGEFFDDVTNWTEATLVDVAAGVETGDINFGLTPTPRGPYHIRGRLRRALNLAAVANAPIFAINVDGQVVASTVTNVDGSYSLDELPAGSYKIMASTAAAASYFGGSNQENATPVNVSEGQSVENADITESTTDVEQSNESVPATFNLEQNFPNPFNPETSIKYRLAGQRDVSLKVFNLLGQEVATLVDQKQEAGVYRVTWDGTNRFGQKVASGVYLFQLKAGDFRMTRKMVMMK